MRRGCCCCCCFLPDRQALCCKDAVIHRPSLSGKGKGLAHAHRAIAVMVAIVNTIPFSIVVPLMNGDQAFIEGLKGDAGAAEQGFVSMQLFDQGLVGRGASELYDLPLPSLWGRRAAICALEVRPCAGQARMPLIALDLALDACRASVWIQWWRW